MSTYTFSLTKDTSINASMEDVTVTAHLDDVQVASGTLTDSGLNLSFTTDLSAGNHSIKITSGKTHGAVALGTLTIDSNVVATTQWDLNNQISGTASTAKQKCATPLHGSQTGWSNAYSNNVWWGIVQSDDSGVDDQPGPFNPCLIVSDHSSYWTWDFTVTDSKKIWFRHEGDTDDILFDSSDEHRYLLVEYVSTSYTLTDDEQNTYNNTLHTSSYGDSSVYDSAGIGWSFIGPGTYNANLQYKSSSLDESNEDADSMVILSANDFIHFLQYHYWYTQNSLSLITVT